MLSYICLEMPKNTDIVELTPDGKKADTFVPAFSFNWRILYENLQRKNRITKPLFDKPDKTLFFITQRCIVLLLTPSAFAAERTVAPFSIMYLAARTALSSGSPFKRALPPFKKSLV